MVVLTLRDLRSERDVIHRQHHLQETNQKQHVSITQMYLLLKIEETVLVFVEVAEHMEAFSFTDVVHHVVLQELVYVVG